MIYVVTDKSTGVEVYRYQADAPIELVGMEFVTHDHTPLVDTASDEATLIRMTWSQTQWKRRFTQVERLAIREQSSRDRRAFRYLQLRTDLALFGRFVACATIKTEFGSAAQPSHAMNRLALLRDLNAA